MNRKVFFTLTVLAVIYWLLFDFLRWEIYDSPSFIGGARFMFGLDGGFDFHSRLTKPLALILPGLLELSTGLHPSYTFLFQNVVCFYLCGILIYKINQIIFKDDNKAFLGMLAYCTCQPFAIFSLFILTDVIGWFFGILGIYLTLQHFSQSENKYQSSIVLGLLMGIGFLAKESAVIGMLFFGSYLLVGKFTFKHKAANILFSIIGFIVPLVISHLVIDHYFNDSILKTILHAHDSTKTDEFTLSNMSQLFRVIDLYWLLIPIGLFSMYAFMKKNGDSHLEKSVLLAAGLSFILLPIWPYFIDRILFMIAPFLIIILVFGIDRFKQLGLPIILIGGLLNILISYLIYRYDVQGSIILSAGVYLGILAIALLYLKKETVRK